MGDSEKHPDARQNQGPSPNYLNNRFISIHIFMRSLILQMSSSLYTIRTNSPPKPCGGSKGANKRDKAIAVSYGVQAFGRATEKLISNYL